MSDKLEQAMKKIHIYLANCKESAYSSEDLIVSKKRIFSLLEELNYAVYDAASCIAICDCYMCSCNR